MKKFDEHMKNILDYYFSNKYKRIDFFSDMKNVKKYDYENVYVIEFFEHMKNKDALSFFEFSKKLPKDCYIILELPRMDFIKNIKNYKDILIAADEYNKDNNKCISFWNEELINLILKEYDFLELTDVDKSTFKSYFVLYKKR